MILAADVAKFTIYVLDADLISTLSVDEIGSEFTVAQPMCFSGAPCTIAP